MANCWIAFGLALDIVGALTIAMPDFPILAKKFTFGKLRLGREALEAGGVHGRGTGSS